MKKQLLCIALIFSIIVPSVNAGVFIPETQYNSFTKEKHMYECGMSDQSQITKYCKIAVDTTEFEKRLELINWYTDFDMLMRQKMYGEMVWDMGYDHLDYMVKGEKNYPGRENAYKHLSTYTNSFTSWATGYLRDSNRDEDYFRDNVKNQLFVLLGRLENNLVGFKYIEIERKNLINAGRIENNSSYQAIYIGNIDEIEKLFKENSYINMVEGDQDLYDTVYFPNVRKYLELEKQWTAFYRNFDHFDEQDYKDLGYNNEEIEKGLKGNYNNSYEDKVEYEYDIKQEVGTNILLDAVVYTEEVVVEKTKLELYAEKWGKNIEKEYPAIEKVIVNYFKKYKAKSGVTQSMVDKKAKLLSDKLPDLVELYEDKYNSTSIKSKKDKYKRFIWIVLLVEKVLEENTF